MCCSTSPLLPALRPLDIAVVPIRDPRRVLCFIEPEWAMAISRGDIVAVILRRVLHRDVHLQRASASRPARAAIMQGQFLTTINAVRFQCLLRPNQRFERQLAAS